MAEALGCYAEYIEQPNEIRGALERAQEKVNQGNVAVVNIKTDHTARAGTQAFAQYST
jgi:glyoxylate carboligase